MDWRLTSTVSSERQVIPAWAHIIIDRSAFVAIRSPIPQFVSFWRSMHLSLVTCRMSAQTLAFSFVVLHLSGSAYTLVCISILWPPL